MVTTPTTKRQARILELDYLKCVFILLMVVFHLVYIGNRYPVAKAFVYTFHMPGFLIISGYLLHVQKPVPQFLRYIQWIFVPYLLMESGYVVMASVLPIREHIQQLTFGLFLDKLFLHPLGPYWYLHTLMLCGIVTYVVAQSANHHRVWMLLGVLLCLWVLALLGLVTWINAVYFCVGVALRLYHRPFIDTFHPAWWSFIGIVLVATCVPNALQRHTIGACSSCISSSLSCFGCIPICPKVQQKSPFSSVEILLFCYFSLPCLRCFPSCFNLTYCSNRQECFSCWWLCCLR